MTFLGEAGLVAGALFLLLVSLFFAIAAVLIVRDK